MEVRPRNCRRSAGSEGVTSFFSDIAHIPYSQDRPGVSNVSIPPSRGSVNGSCGGLRSLRAPSGHRRTVILPETAFIQEFGAGRGRPSPSPPRPTHRCRHPRCLRRRDPVEVRCSRHLRPPRDLEGSRQSPTTARPLKYMPGRFYDLTVEAYSDLHVEEPSCGLSYFFADLIHTARNVSALILKDKTFRSSEIAFFDIGSAALRPTAGRPSDVRSSSIFASASS